MSKVLLVDDMKAELDLLHQYLTEAGYDVTTANNGKEALEMVDNNKPDIIVTDWMMPEMGGLDLCRQLKKNPDTATIPVVACTAKNRDVDKMWATKQGVKAYVIKPCTKEDLVSAVKSAINF
ncbi:response regulator [Cyanobacterium aponinum UTEX 3222]|uniref:Response regulator n=1 Tax=Cyanobacterium aponinum AL20115 TaxID=3090662 RepID=A0AAF0ZE57_9CHRO|nr:response regulator [Cyanobacterium aponinum]PHV61683.1 two-component system response regulator [Cyanobacterium aponinum IPPAS B-1201]WPF88422.1 response regulator [Cyanobacterium aponinum AL20115]WRL39884.1 response regulator [Cyanobacterium aponinum UTEX 3221]WRL42728.1 response regulator [Cyanobacterium aponinum UTEX 3222]